MKKYFSLSWINTYVFLGVYLWYVIAMMTGGVKTNIATWMIFSVSASINAFSYYFATEKDLTTSRIYFASALACIAVTIASLFTGQFSPVGSIEIATFAISLFALVVWGIANKLQREGAVIAQLVNIVVVFIGFIPLYLAQAVGKADENPVMWGLWCGTLIVQCYVVTDQWKGRWIEIVGPVSYLWFHIFVVLLTFVEIQIA